MGVSLALADIQLAQGRLRDAQRTFEYALGLATTHPGLRGAADMHAGLSEVLIERNDLDGAADHLETSTELGEAAGLPSTRTVGASPPPDCSAPVATSMEPSRSSTKRCRSTQPTSRLPSDPSRRSGPGYSSREATSMPPTSGSDDTASEPMTPSATSASSSTSPSLGCSSRKASPATTTRRSSRRGRSWTGFAMQRRPGAGSAAPSRSSCCSQPPTTPRRHPLRNGCPGRRAGRAEPEGHIRLFLHAGPAVTGLLRSIALREAGGSYAAKVLATAEQPHRLARVQPAFRLRSRGKEPRRRCAPPPPSPVSAFTTDSCHPSGCPDLCYGPIGKTAYQCSRLPPNYCFLRCIACSCTQQMTDICLPLHADKAALGASTMSETREQNNAFVKLLSPPSPPPSPHPGLMHTFACKICPGAV